MIDSIDSADSRHIPTDDSALSILTGRLEPHIYAFRIEQFPPSYKVGDTFREVDTRINEWRNIYRNLELTHDAGWEWSAMAGDRFFRDYAVHRYLEDEKGRKAMAPEAFGDNHPSSEFYLDTEIKDIEEAIAHIRTHSQLPESPYKFYSADTLKEIEQGFVRNLTLRLRDNQAAVVDKFLASYSKGRRNMLMYAVMRFGKTFTALCCAQRIGARTVLVVSAKADVSTEWKKNVQGITILDKFKFYDGKTLGRLDFDKELSEGNTVVLFMTLQDIQGTKIKFRHKKIFDQSRKWDMVIVDESHFGARAPQYGLPLLDAGDAAVTEDKVKDTESADLLDEELKYLRRNVTLHLSGTPYRILMTDEFKDDDLIACVRYPDIVKARDEWYKHHIDQKKDDGSDYEDWDNPYFGFPQMVRFAFNLNEDSLNVIKGLEDEDASVRFAELFRPLSTRKNNKTHSYRTFCHEREVLSFLQVIDGSKDDENVLGFLDNERIRQGQLCHHIVMVLPFRASCDAMATLIEKNKALFRNLGDYEIINVAGLDAKDKVQNIARKISEYESEGRKTISLTVRRMLTGVTVPEWDTMIYIKETFSPEEYDQAVYRLQNQYIKVYQNPDGSIVKYNMKPQTILVDFDPQRMYKLQERKCLIYNSTPQLRDRQSLKEFIDDELTSSPIITLDHHKLRQIDAADLLDEVRRYAQARGIPEEAEAIPVDAALLANKDVIKAITGLNDIGSKGGISRKANEIDGDGDSVDVTGPDETPGAAIPKKPKKGDKEPDNIAGKLATYYSLILYFAFLTPNRVTSLQDIIRVMGRGENRRIARHVGIDRNILKIIASARPWTLFELNKSINDTNHTALRSDLSREEMVDVVLKRCNRLSDSEIVTPANVADDMVALLPDGLFDGEGVVLDIASKQGEFAVALKKRYGDRYPEECNTRIYSLCTSGLAYEFTRKTYHYLGFDTDNIISGKTSYDIIASKFTDKKKKQYITAKDILGKDMKIKAIIGNPPYHEENDGYGSGSNPLYHLFIELGRVLSTLGTMIHPARFLFNAGKTPKIWNEEVLSDPHFKLVDYNPKSTDVFDNVDVKGGIAITMWDKNQSGESIGFFSPYPEIKGILRAVQSRDYQPFSDIVYPRDLYKLTDKLYEENPWAEGRQSQGHRLDVGSSIFEVFPELFYDEAPNETEYIGIYGLLGRERVTKWIKKDYIKLPDNIDKFKVLIPKSNGSGALGEALSTPVIGAPNIGHTLTFLSIGCFDDISQAEACLKYIKTRFARLLLGTLKVTQDNPKDTWVNVPLQDFTANSDIDWDKIIEEIDAQLYEKYHLSDKEADFIDSMIKEM